VCTSTDYDAWRTDAAPVTVEEVLKTLKTNAALSKHITASILAAVHEAVESKQVATKAEGGMKFSLMTPHSEVSAEELWRLKYVLPAYFEDATDPALKRRAVSKARVRPCSSRCSFTAG